MSFIPVIDFALISDRNGETLENKENWKVLANQVYEALSKIGFMYIINHGIPEQKIHRAFIDSETFFNQPVEAKEKCLIDMSRNYEGYTRPGQQILSDTSLHEFRECFSLVDPAAGNVCQDDDDEAHELILTLQELRRECQRPLRILLKLMAASLSLRDDEYFVKNYNRGDLHQNPKLNSSMMRTHFYPPLRETLEVSETSVRCSEHTDFGILTLLFQDSMGGLEVKDLKGQWIQASPIPGAILVNTGDVMELWTSGHFRATPHRVLIPEEEIRKRTKRQSIVYFVNPDDETLISPLDAETEMNSWSKHTHSARGFEPIVFKNHYHQRLTDSYRY